MFVYTGTLGHSFANLWFESLAEWLGGSLQHYIHRFDSGMTLDD